MQHKEVLNRVVSTGMDHELAYFPVMELPTPIMFHRARRKFTHFQPAAYVIGGDYPDLAYHGVRDSWVGMEPQLSIRLQESKTAVDGIVGRLHYVEFALRDRRFKDGTPIIDTFLIPDAYTVEKGDHFEDNFRYGREIEVGSSTDRGELAVLTGRALAATALLLGGYDQEQLSRIAGVQNYNDNQ